MSRTAVFRLILLACGVLAVAGGATAMRVNHWSPIDAFLEHRNTTPLVGSTLASDVKPGGADIANHSAFGSYTPTAVPPAVGYMSAGGGAAVNGSASSQGWSDDHLQGAASAGSSGPSASLGGLWRLMGLAHHDVTTHTASAGTHGSAARTAAPKPPKTGHSSGGTTVTAPVAGAAQPVGTIAMVTAPAILIGSDPPAIANLIGSTGNALGTPGGTNLTRGVAAGGSLSATPEPGSALLIGTGLLGLAIVLRRRIA